MKQPNVLSDMDQRWLVNCAPMIVMPVAGDGRGPIDEAAVHTAWALRFDGYRYRDETSFDFDRHVRHFLRTGGKLAGVPWDHRAAYCLAQRFWVRDWWIERDSFRLAYLRTLFLAVVDYPDEAVPYHLRHRERWDGEDFRRLLPFKARITAAVNCAHARSRYESFSDALQVVTRKPGRKVSVAP